MSDDSLNVKLFKAVRDNNPDAVQNALKAGADVNCTDEYDNSLYIVAADRGYESVMKILLEAFKQSGEGVDCLMKANALKMTPFLAAARGGYVGIMKMLLQVELSQEQHQDYKIDIAHCDVKNENFVAKAARYGHLAVLEAFDEEIKKLSPAFDYLPIQNAIRFGHEECVLWFLKKLENPSSTCLAKILGNATQYANASLFRAILEQLKKDPIDSLLKELLVSSVLKGEEETARLLADYVPDLNYVIDKSMPHYFVVGKGTPLCAAIQTRNKCLVEMLINKGASCDFGNEDNTLLQTAVAMNDEEIVDLILAHVKDSDAPDKHGNKTLFYVNEKTPLSLFEKLLKSGCDAHAACYDDAGGLLNQYITRNCPLPVIKRLIEEGVDVNRQDAEGNTPLHLAAAKNNTDLLQVLIKGGADVHRLNEREETPLAKAVDYSCKEAVALLLNAGSDPNQAPRIAKANSENCPLVKRAYYSKNADILQLLLEAGAQADAPDLDGNTVLGAVISCGDEGYADLLIKGGADVNAMYVDYSSSLPVQLPLLSHAIQKRQESILQKLLDAGADCEKLDSLGHTPLITAISNSNYAAVERLLKAGACIEGSILDTTPLIWVCANKLWDTEMIDKLIQFKANVNAQDKNGNTPLMVALQHCSGCSQVPSIKSLLAAGADVFLPNNRGVSPYNYPQMSKEIQTLIRLHANKQKKEQCAKYRAWLQTEPMAEIIKIIQTKEGLQKVCDSGALMLVAGKMNHNERMKLRLQLYTHKLGSQKDIQDLETYIRTHRNDSPDIRQAVAAKQNENQR